MKRKVYAVGRIRLKKAGAFFLAAAVLASGVFLKDTAKPVLEKVSVISAGLAMPEGGMALLKQERERVKNETEKAEGNVSLPPPGKVYEGDKKSPAAAGDESLAYTPEDIAALIKAAEEKSKNVKWDGKIAEYTYTKKNATDVFENISVNNKTAEHKIDIPAELKKEPDLKIEDKTKPVVLIYHTHTTEGYQALDKGQYSSAFPTRSRDEKQNMIRVGDEIEAQLKKAGIGVIHDRNIYDTKYSGAYYRSEAQIDKYMKEYPSLQVLLDIHRDAIKNPKTGVMTKPTAVIGGKKAAQIMIVSGCEDGGVAGFPDWEYNLRFALRLQKECEDKYPGLTRPLFFCSRQYNMHKSRCSLLIEMGSDANTLDEAAYSGRLLGDVLASLLEKYTV